MKKSLKSSMRIEKLDFNVLSTPPSDFFTIKLYETINKMLKFSGITNDMSSSQMKNYIVMSPREVSYSDHADYFREAVGDEHTCILNDKKSEKSYCLAFKKFNVTLRSGPGYKEGTRGMCIFCQRFYV